MTISGFVAFLLPHFVSSKGERREKWQQGHKWVLMGANCVERVLGKSENIIINQHLQFINSMNRRSANFQRFNENTCMH